MKKFIREWLKEKFNLYDIKDLTIGGHCGGCGDWINNIILPKNWAVGICKKCLREYGEKDGREYKK